MKTLMLSVCMLLGTAALTPASRKATGGTTETTNHCVHVTFSCGVAEDICNFTGTMKQLVAQVLASDASMCRSPEPEPFM